MSEVYAEQGSPLTLALWESWPWGHESQRVDPAPSQLPYWGKWELQVSQPQGCECGRAGPVTFLLRSGLDKGEMISPSWLATYSRQENWPQGHQIRKAGPAPHLLQHSGEQALYLRWATQ